MAAIILKNEDELNKILEKNGINIPKDDVKTCYDDYQMMAESAQNQKPVTIDSEYYFSQINAMLQQNIASSVLKNKLDAAKNLYSDRNYNELKHASDTMISESQMARDCWKNGYGCANLHEYDADMKREASDDWYTFSLQTDLYVDTNDEDLKVEYSSSDFARTLNMARMVSLNGVNGELIRNTIGDDFDKKLGSIIESVDEATKFDVYDLNGNLRISASDQVQEKKRINVDDLNENFDLPEALDADLC